MQFQAGDVVRLKSGGPKMTIEQIGEQYEGDATKAWCQWFENNKLTTGVFPITSLEPD